MNLFAHFGAVVEAALTDMAAAGELPDGIDTSRVTVETPRDLRLAVWGRLAGDLRPQHLDRIGHTTIAFDELPGAFQAYMDGTVTGRVVVEIQ